MITNKLSKSSRVIVITVIILVIIYLIYHACKKGYIPSSAFQDTYNKMIISSNKKYNKFFNSSVNLYAKTIGYQNNEISKLALQKAIKKDNLYSYNEKKGKMSKKSENDAMVNAFIAGDLYRYTVAPNSNSYQESHEALQNSLLYYNKALTRLQKYSKNIVHENNKNYNDPSMDQVVSRVENFYNNEVVNSPQPDFTDIRNNIRNTRAKSLTTGKNKQELYYKNRKIKNDPQNVHDTELTNELLNKYIAIKTANNNTLSQNTDISEIYTAVNNHTWKTESDKNRATEILNKISQNGTVSSLQNASEKEILLHVWNRINSIDNNKQQQHLRNSLLEALRDSMELSSSGNYLPVCANGRVSRIIESLTLLDANKKISNPVKTEEILRNEIFLKAYSIVNKNIQSADQELRDVYTNVNRKLNENSQKKLQEFENKIKSEIQSTMLLEYPNVKPDILHNIIQDAQAGV